MVVGLITACGFVTSVNTASLGTDLPVVGLITACGFVTIKYGLFCIYGFISCRPDYRLRFCYQSFLRKNALFHILL